MSPLRVGVTLEQCWHRVPGGTARSILELTATLRARGVVAPVGVSARHRLPPEPDFRPTIEVRQLPLPRPALYEAWHYARRMPIERATGHLDVAHATGVAIPPTDAPLVVTIHDLAFVRYPDHPTRRGKRFFERGTALARRHADLVLCPSQATARDCIDQGFDAGRVRVIPWGVDQRRATEAEITAVRKSFSLPDRFVLFTGTIEPRKNLPRLLEAHRLLGDDTPLVIAGPVGWNEDLAPLLQGREASVLLLGFVAPETLTSLYAAASVFCYPSLSEGFGLPVLEAMAQGTPVVTSLGTATEEVGGDAAVLVDPLDTEAIARAIAELLDDDEAAGHRGLEGARRAADFTWTRTAELTEDAYHEAAGR